jgi:hypothetical protein
MMTRWTILSGILIRKVWQAGGDRLGDGLAGDGVVGREQEVERLLLDGDVDGLEAEGLEDPVQGEGAVDVKSGAVQGPDHHAYAPTLEGLPCTHDDAVDHLVQDLDPEGVALLLCLRLARTLVRRLVLEIPDVLIDEVDGRLRSTQGIPHRRRAEGGRRRGLCGLRVGSGVGA